MADPTRWLARRVARPELGHLLPQRLGPASLCRSTSTSETSCSITIVSSISPVSDRIGMAVV